MMIIFLVEVAIIVIVVIKPRLNCCLGREVLVLKRYRYNRVIAFAGGRERERKVRANAELEGCGI